MTRSDRVPVAAAQINGIAAGAVQVNRVTDEEALAEVAAVRNKLPKAELQVALNLAIVAYARPGSGKPEMWYGPAAAFLERAGARSPE